MLDILFPFRQQKPVSNRARLAQLNRGAKHNHIAFDMGFLDAMLYRANLTTRAKNFFHDPSP